MAIITESEQKKVETPATETTVDPIVEPDALLADLEVAAKAKEKKLAAAGAPNAFERARRLINNIGAFGAISEAGTAYLNTIMSKLVDTYNARCWIISKPATAMVVAYGSKVIILIMGESVPPVMRTDLNPYVAMAVPITENWKTMCTSGRSEDRFDMTGAEVSQVIVVTPEDYPNVGIMYNRIAELITVQTQTDIKELSMDDIVRNYNLRVSVNMDEVNAYMNGHFPLAVKPRADYGFMVYINDRNRNNTMVQQAYGNDAYNPAEEAFGVVTGYTEFIPAPGTNNMGIMFGQSTQHFIPVVHISYIGGMLPTLGTAAMLIPLAYEIFLNNGLWAAPYRNIGKNRPNLGNLWPDPANGGAPVQFENQAQVNAALQSLFEPPILVLDVTEGSFHIPALSSFTMPQATNELAKEFSEFLRVGGLDGQINLPEFSSLFYREYCGSIPARNNEIKDSRWYDFLSTMTIYSSDYARVRYMLNRGTDPRIRASQLREFFSEMKLLYDCSVAAIHTNTLRLLMSACQSRTQLSITGLSGQMQQQQLDMTAILQNTAGMNTISGLMPGGGTAQINPISGIYRLS